MTRLVRVNLSYDSETPVGEKPRVDRQAQVVMVVAAGFFMHIYYIYVSIGGRFAEQQESGGQYMVGGSPDESIAGGVV